MNIDEQVLYISLIFQFFKFCCLFHILELTVCRGNSLHYLTFQFFLLLLSQLKGIIRLYNVIKWHENMHIDMQHLHQVFFSVAITHYQMTSG